MAADELAPGDAGSLASGSEPCFTQELADRRRRDAEPERAELARDPLVAPATVLARESQDQLGDQAKARLDEIKNWLAVHNDAVMAVLFLVFGAKLIADGLPPLT